MSILKFKAFSFFILGIVILSGCNKESKIHRNLSWLGGEWVIEKYQYRYDLSSGSGSQIEENLGTYKFQGNGKGKLTWVKNGQTLTNLFSYKNYETTLDIDFQPGQIHNQGGLIQYTLDWQKNKVNLYLYQFIGVNNGHTYFTEYVIDLKKK